MPSLDKNRHLSVLGISRTTLIARGLSECEEATTLQLAEIGANGRHHLLTPVAAAAWLRLKNAALADGVEVFIVSAFRSMDRQAEIVRQKLDTGISLEEVLSVCAPPGFSEHHSGRAVDLSTPGCRSLTTAFDGTAAYRWLEQRASFFGYRLSYPPGNADAYQYEPWHWCFHDKRQDIAITETADSSAR